MACAHRTSIVSNVIASFPGRAGEGKNGLVSIVCACVVAPRFVGVRICTCSLRVMLAVTLRAHSRIIYIVSRVLLKWRSAFLVLTKGLRSHYRELERVV